MNIDRRNFLSFLGKGTGAAVAALALPGLAWAKRNDQAFQSDKLEDAIASRYPGLASAESDLITLTAPTIAENGAVVPISVSTTLPNVTSISLFVAENPRPLAASFNLGPANVPDVSIRIRMGKTTNLIAAVESDGMIYTAQQEVKVTIGGCGG